MAPHKKTEKPTPKITKRTLQRDIKNMIDKKVILAKDATNKVFYALLDRPNLK